MNSLFIVTMKKMHFSKILLVVYLLSNLVDTKSYGQSTSSYEFGSGLHFESNDQNYQFDLGGLLLPYISYESINDETVKKHYKYAGRTVNVQYVNLPSLEIVENAVSYTHLTLPTKAHG